MDIKEKYPEGMDIFNRKERLLVCVSNIDGGWWNNKKKEKELLVVGEKYTVVGIVIDDFHTDIYLKEFPKVPFNSVLFHENMEEYSVILKEREAFFSDYYNK